MTSRDPNKRYRVFHFSLLWTVIIGIAVALSAVLVSVGIMKAVRSNATPHHRQVIVLDAGHGGFDGGADANGLVEKDVNLAIALKLRDLLRSGGFEVKMTREEDKTTADGGRTDKPSDMNNRLQLIKDNPGCIFISIHQNKFEDPTCTGAQVFYGPSEPMSQSLAQCIQQSFADLLQPGNTRIIKKSGKELFLLYYADVPAVIVECGFLSNPGEARLLADEEYQNKVAFTVYAGLLNYLEENQAADVMEF